MAAAYGVGTAVVPMIQNNYSSSKAIWIDDLRVQPMDAQAMAYVYDLATLRLIASFDDQNFGLFYQYNAEGKLVRKMVETQNGLKTVTETQYHSPSTARNH
jgi:YD repeat-containing protein